MSYVKIGGELRSLADASERWIADQLQRRKQDGASTCVQVILKVGELDIVLSTADCPSGEGGSRPLRPREQQVVDLWTKHGLHDQRFAIGNLIAFLHHLQRSL